MAFFLLECVCVCFARVYNLNVRVTCFKMTSQLCHVSRSVFANKHDLIPLSVIEPPFLWLLEATSSSLSPSPSSSWAPWWSSLYLSNVKKEKNTYFVNFALVYQQFRHKYSQFNHSNINIICSHHKTKVQLLKGGCWCVYEGLHHSASLFYTFIRGGKVCHVAIKLTLIHEDERGQTNSRSVD